MLRDPPNGDPYLGHLAAIIRGEILRKEVAIVGWRHDGTTLFVRFRAPLFVPFVRVHVQNTVAGNGGPTFSETDFVSSDLVDCREERLQEVEIAEVVSERHIIFLIPAEKDGAGDLVEYNGIGGVPDYMSFLDPGV